jgi:magnesium-transporting ATPase (P-type)
MLGLFYSYGINSIPEVRQKSLLSLVWDALHDKSLIVLIIAALVSLAIGIYQAVSLSESLAYSEGVAIIIAGKESIDQVHRSQTHSCVRLRFSLSGDRDLGQCHQ